MVSKVVRIQNFCNAYPTANSSQNVNSYFSKIAGCKLLFEIQLA